MNTKRIENLRSKIKQYEKEISRLLQEEEERKVKERNKKRQYYLANIDKYKKYDKEYRQDNKQKLAEYHKARNEKLKEDKKRKILHIISKSEYKTIVSESNKKYFVTSDGRFFNETKELKSASIASGYKVIRIGKTRLAHRVVWEAFNGEIPEGMEIDHINTIRSDNRLENLRLVTSKENKNNPITLEKFKESNKGKIGYELALLHELKKKKVYQYTLDGELIKIWNSAYECEKNGFKHKSIRDCCNGKQKTHKNFVWSYENSSIKIC